jgi:hypothetical protein
VKAHRARFAAGARDWRAWSLESPSAGRWRCRQPDRGRFEREARRAGSGGFGYGTARRTSAAGLSSRRPSYTTWRSRLSSVQVRYLTSTTSSGRTNGRGLRSVASQTGCRAVEAHAEQVLNLLRVTPSDPAGRLVCTRDRRQARDGYDVAVWIDGAALSQLAQRGTCHRPSMWRASAAKASPSSRAPVTGSFRPPETPRSDVILQRSALGAHPARTAT